MKYILYTTTIFLIYLIIFITGLPYTQKNQGTQRNLKLKKNSGKLMELQGVLNLFLNSGQFFFN